MMQKLRKILTPNLAKGTAVPTNQEPARVSPLDEVVHLAKKQGCQPHKCFQAVLTAPKSKGGLDMQPPPHMQVPPIEDFDPDLVAKMKSLVSAARYRALQNYELSVESVYESGGTTCDTPDRWVAASLASTSCDLANRFYQSQEEAADPVGRGGFTTKDIWVV